MRLAYSLLVLLALLLTGCSAHPTATTQPGRLVPTPLGLPFPDDRSASGLTEYRLLGRETQLRSLHATDNGDSLELETTAGTPEYGVYRFHPPTAPDNVKVSFGAGTSGAWIGVADYTRHEWSFTGPFSDDQVIALSGGDNVSPGGNIYVAIVVYPSDSALVDELQLFAVNIPPTADFTVTPPSGVMPLTVDFDASASSDGDGTIADYAWDFDNDGLYEVDGGDQPLAQHVFTETGSYHVSLRVTDNSGDTDTHSADVEVFADYPTASFTVTPQQQVNPLDLSYLFDASASEDPLGGPLTYDWDFDGDAIWDSLGGAVQENHSYSHVGTYEALLRVTDQHSISATASRTVYCPSVCASFYGQPGTYTRQSPIVGAQTNHVKWSFATGGITYSSPTVGPDGTVYIGADKLYALSDNGTATPTVKWTYSPPPGTYIYSAPAVGSDGTVYFGGWGSRKVYAVTDNGTSAASLKWTYNTGGDIYGSPVVGPDGTIYIGSNDNNMFALVDNGTSASKKWILTTGSFVQTAPAIGPDGTVYVTSYENRIYAVIDNGTLTPTIKWSWAAGGSIMGSPALGPDGTVYIGSYDNNMYALVDNGTTTPTVKWSFPTGNMVRTSPALGPDGTVYFGSYDKSVYAVKDNGTATASSVWTFPTDGNVISSPTLGADGMVYIGSEDGKLYALRGSGATSPPVIWSYATGNKIHGSPSIGPDGTVYVASTDNTLYAFGS